MRNPLGVWSSRVELYDISDLILFIYTIVASFKENFAEDFTELVFIVIPMPAHIHHLPAIRHQSQLIKMFLTTSWVFSTNTSQTTRLSDAHFGSVSLRKLHSPNASSLFVWLSGGSNPQWEELNPWHLDWNIQNLTGWLLSGSENINCTPCMNIPKHE